MDYDLIGICFGRSNTTLRWSIYKKYSVCGFFDGMPRLSCGAASNIMKFLCRWSFSSSIAATFPHLKLLEFNYKLRILYFDNFDLNKEIWIKSGRFNLKNSKENAINLPIAIVWCWPNGQYSLIEMPFVSLHNQLMRSTNHINIVCIIELCHNIRSK